jgi:anthranilate/para-aminobenzoate synthase component I
VIAERDLADLEPVEAARLLRRRRGFAFLDSAQAAHGSLSLLACEPDLVLTGGPGDWPAFEEELRRRARETADIGCPDGAAIGWLGYDGRFCFGFYDSVAVYRHADGCWVGGCSGSPAAMKCPPTYSTNPLPPGSPLHFRAAWSREGFVAAVRQAQDYIAAGDIYQVCLAHPFVAEPADDLFDYYLRLRDISPAPYAAFLDLNGIQVASSSPECFLRMSGSSIETRPIKGTRRREDEPDLDERAAFELLTSAKEVAELVMITDLERNDLGRICEFGSVTVPELLKLERFAQVHHLVSTVRGTLRPGVGHARALRLCSPGGSISGAPKMRAMEIIAGIEPWLRGLYTGALGYFGFNGESCFSIAIRTVTQNQKEARFFVGAGIVADSDPSREWQETLDKAAGMLAASSPAG